MTEENQVEETAPESTEETPVVAEETTETESDDAPAVDEESAE